MFRLLKFIKHRKNIQKTYTHTQKTHTQALSGNPLHLHTRPLDGAPPGEHRQTIYEQKMKNKLR